MGLPLAVNAGDALAVLSLEVLRAGTGRLGRRLGLRVLSEFSSAMWQTLEGQAVELGWRRDGVTDLSPQSYLELILRKTCWYTTIAPLRIGALIGSWGSADLQALSRFGLFLGGAFQITDDILNLTGGQAAYGKEIRGDLREGKRTLMVIHLLSVAEPAHRDAVVALLRGPEAERTERPAGLAGRPARAVRQHRLRPGLRPGCRRRGRRRLPRGVRVGAPAGAGRGHPAADRLRGRADPLTALVTGRRHPVASALTSRPKGA